MTSLSPRSKGAVVVGTALMLASLLLTQHRSQLVGTATAPTATSSELTLRNSHQEYVPITDANNDGVPDWQELLIATEPLQMPTSTDTYQPPDTLTEEFALDFFQSYVRNQQYGEFGANPEEFVARSATQAIAQTQDTLYTRDNITTYEATPEQVRVYANAVADIMLAYPVPEGTRNAIDILEEATQLNRPAVLEELTPIRDGYAQMTTDMLALPAPAQLTQAHLDLTNVYQAIATSMTAMQQTYTDPLAALIRVRRYADDVRGLENAITNFFTAAVAAGANFEPGDRVFDVVELN